MLYNNQPLYHNTLVQKEYAVQAPQNSNNISMKNKRMSSWATVCLMGMAYDETTRSV